MGGIVGLEGPQRWVGQGAPCVYYNCAYCAGTHVLAGSSSPFAAPRHADHAPSTACSYSTVPTYTCTTHRGGRSRPTNMLLLPRLVLPTPALPPLSSTLLSHRILLAWCWPDSGKDKLRSGSARLVYSVKTLEAGLD